MHSDQGVNGKLRTSQSHLLRLDACWGAALYPLRLWAFEVALRDPGLVVSLCATGDCGAVGSQHSSLITAINLLAALGRRLCALSALSTR